MNDSPSDPRVSPPAERHVFVSFASEDLALADHVLDGLERSGLRGWIAHRDIPTGASYPAAIRAAVESSGALLLLLTAAANASPHVLREIEMAFNARVPILPVRIAGQEPSPDLLYFLSTTQWFDAGTGFDEDDSAHVHAAVRALLHGRGQRTRLLAGSSHGRRRVAVAAAALLVLIGAVIVFVVTRPDTPDGETASRSPSRRGSGLDEPR